MSDIHAGSGGSSLVARWDPDAGRFVITGWTYGPAGPATVQLTPSVRLSVDYAAPNRLNEITIDTPIDDAADRALRSLLGSEVIDDVVALSGSRSRVVGEFRVPDDLARLALLVEIAADPDAPLAKTARAAREALSLRLAGSAVIDDETLRWLGHLADQDDEPRSMPTVAAAGASPPMPMAEMAADALAETAPARRLKRKVAEERLDIGPAIETASPSGSARQVRATEIEVRDRGPASGRWARVFRRTDRLLIALSPLQDARHGSRALVVTPTGLDPSDLLVDVTDDPGAARPSPLLILVRAAVTAGREACRLERIGYGGAEHAWLECARAWDAAGGSERADTAREYASGGRRQVRGDRIVPAPLDADYLE